MRQLLIKNARFVDDSIKDILIEDGIIQKISHCIETDDKIPTVILDQDCYLSAGWIDAHTHCFEKFEIYADNCEEIGYKKGVTAVVDAGTAGADNIDEFYQSVQNCRTHVYSLLNISKTGIYAQNELADMHHIDEEAFIKACQKYPDFIIGVKARMSKSVVGESGDQPLFKALEIAKRAELPLMVHIGSAPTHIETVMNHVRKGDIVTHIFNPKTNGIIEDGKIRSCVMDAYQRGVYFDLGHGTDSFSFDVLEQANKQHLKVYTISSDIYYRNRLNGPVYDLATVMSKLYQRGYTLEEVIEAVTSHPAKMYHLEKRGEIKQGYKGELTVFRVVEQEKNLIDSTQKTIRTASYIEPVAVIMNDEYICLKEKENG